MRKPSTANLAATMLAALFVAFTVTNCPAAAAETAPAAQAAPAAQTTPTASIRLSTSGKHNFGYVATGSKADYGVQVSNGGSQPLPFSLTLTGSEHFTQKNTCGQSLAPGKKCEVIFTYAAPAGANGIDQAEYSIAENGLTFTSGNGGNPANGGILLAHPAQPGVLHVNTAKHNFTEIKVGSSSELFGLVLSNGADHAVSLKPTPKGAANQFQLNNQCPAQLAEHGSCVITIVFHPTAAGWQTMELDLGINGAPVEPAGTITLIGNGVQ